MADYNELKGALYECVRYFPMFYFDFEILLREGYMQITSSETCKWLKSNKSLAEYFKGIRKDAKKVPGGFWAPIEKTFGKKRHTLRRLVGRFGNENDKIHKVSIDYSWIKPILEENRYRKGLLKAENEFFKMIKYLVIMAEEEEPESIHTALEKIKKIINYLEKITDKNDEKVT